MQSPQSPGTFADYLVNAIVRWPGRVAFDDLDREYRYGEIAESLSQLMALFARDGGIRNKGVGILSTNAVPTWMTAAATKMSGGYVVSLPVRGSPEDLAFFVNDASISILVVHAGLAELGAQLIASCPGLEKVYTIAGTQLGPDLMVSAAREGAATLRAVPGLHGDDVCEIKYTGGTTGVSKGAVHTQWSTLMQSLTIPVGVQIPYGARYLCAGPMSHSGYPWIAPTLFGGGAIIINPTFDPELFIHTVETRRATFVNAVPTMIYKLLDVAATRDIDFSSIDCFMYGASPMSPARLREGHERWGRVFTQCYGCVEALGVGMVLPMGLHDPDRPDMLLSCGHPYPSVTAVLLDDEGHEVPEGATGEICLRTPATMREYLNKPEETAEAFKFGWLHTGDLATRSPEGLYTIVDRKKDVIVTGGFNVFSPQVETVISADASVSSVAVIGVPDPIWGEAVKAIVTAAPGHRIDPAHIQAIVRSAKGAVNTPKTVDVIDEMPLTTAGKIDKRALRRRYWSNEVRQVS